jgi:hypothetical protein
MQALGFNLNVEKEEFDAAAIQYLRSIPIPPSPASGAMGSPAPQPLHLSGSSAFTPATHYQRVCGARAWRPVCSVFVS